MKSSLRSSLLLMAAAALVGCGKKSKSDNAHVSLIPSQPIVFTAPTSYVTNFTTVNVPAPWFKFSVNLHNETGDELTVIAVSVTISGTDMNGQFSTKTVAFDASQFDYTTLSYSCSYFSFGDFPNGSNNALSLNTTDTGCNSGSMVQFYVGSLPDSGAGFYSYTVKLQLDGWFGTETVPTDRFQKIVYFSTQ